MPHAARPLQCVLQCVQHGIAQFTIVPNSTHDSRCAGEIAEKKQPRLSRKPSMPALCEALRKAAYDPRISGLVLNLDLLGIGWAKAQELRKHIAFFRLSGKATVAYMKRGGEKEYYLATACDEIYVPPTAQLSLRGLSVGSAFLRGVLDKVGVEPQVRHARVCCAGLMFTAVCARAYANAYPQLHPQLPDSPVAQLYHCNVHAVLDLAETSRRPVQ